MPELLDKLAFYLDFPFVRYAIIVGVLVSLCSSLLGVTLVLKRYSYIGDGLSHVAFGALSIAAVLKITNNMLTQDITISGSGNMSRDEIDRAIRDAQRYAAEDRQRKQAQQVRDAAESLLNQARKTRKKLKDEDRSRLDASIAALEGALKDGNEQRIRTASEDLDRILRSVGTYTSAPEGGNDDGAYDA